MLSGLPSRALGLRGHSSHCLLAHRVHDPREAGDLAQIKTFSTRAPGRHRHLGICTAESELRAVCIFSNASLVYPEHEKYHSRHRSCKSADPGQRISIEPAGSTGSSCRPACRRRLTAEFTQDFSPVLQMRAREVCQDLLTDQTTDAAMRRQAGRKPGLQTDFGPQQNTGKQRGRPTRNRR